MKVSTSRFGTLEVEPSARLEFPNGVIGFPFERRFVVLPHRDSRTIAWLQSLVSPAFALPVVSAHALPFEYPDVPLTPYLSVLGVPFGAEVAVLCVLSAAVGRAPTVNLIAPIVIDSEARIGGQVILANTRFSACERLALLEPRVDPPAAREATASPSQET